MKFNERLKEMREEEKYSQAQLAKELDLPRYTISDWEQGRAEPDTEMLKKIADFFCVSLDYVLGRSEDYFAFSYKSKQRELTMEEGTKFSSKK